MYKIETRKDKIKVIRTLFEVLVLILIAFAVVRALCVTHEYKPYDADDPSIVSGSDDGFIVVSYFGVDRQGTSTLISTEALDEQLKALHDLGYVTITQSDIENYYEKGTALPDKAMFLMFEDGRRDTALFAEKLLEKYNFKATILSYADKFAEKDSKFLSPEDLKQLEASGYWELGTNGYRLSYINSYDRYDRFLGQMTSDEFVRVSSCLGRDYNHYLMDYIRDEDRVPTESRSEMESRITQDYRYMEKIYSKSLGSVPELYCLMHSNTGRYGNTATVSAANEENIKDLFAMNFNRDGYALNNRDVSIYDLTRIQPQAYWSTNHLLMRIWDDMPDVQKSKIVFVNGEGKAADKGNKSWKLDSGAAEYKTDSIILTSMPQSEGKLTLNEANIQDADVSVRLRGNKFGTQTVYMRASEDDTRYISVSIQNNRLVISEKADGSYSELFTYDLHDQVKNKDRVSVEEDKRDTLAAEYSMRGRFADSAADSAVFYHYAKETEKTEARSVEDGAEEYIPELQINELGDTKLRISLTDDIIQVWVNGEDVTGKLSVSVNDAGTVKLGANWGGWGYSQRNVADDVYDGVFQSLYVSDNGTAVYDGRLHGIARIWKHVKDVWNTVLNWFIVNL